MASKEQVEQLEVLLGKGDTSAAKKEVQKLLRADPSDRDALLVRARILGFENKLDQALEILDKLLRKDRDFHDARVIKAAVLIRQAKLSKAEELLREVLKRKPRHALAHFNLGDACERQGNLREAEKQFKKACDLSPDSSQFWFAYGRVLWDLKKYTDSYDALNKAIACNPGLVMPWLILSDMQCQFGLFRDGVQTLAAALRVHPHDPELRTALVHALCGGKAPDEAAEVARGLIEEFPDSADARVLLGICHMTAARPAEAEAAMREALERNPKHPGALLNLARLLVARGGAVAATEGKDTYKRALAADHKSWEAALGLGLLLTRETDAAPRREGVKMLDKAVQLSGGNALVRLGLARGLVQAGDQARAAQVCRELVKDADVTPPLKSEAEQLLANLG